MTSSPQHHLDMQHAIRVGFTRADLLLMGELIDVTTVAEELHLGHVVAISGRVDVALRDLAAQTGLLYRRVLKRLMVALVDALALVSALRDDAELTCRIPGLPFPLNLHVGFDDSGEAVLTVYAAGESVARVVPARF